MFNKIAHICRILDNKKLYKQSDYVFQMFKKARKYYNDTKFIFKKSSKTFKNLDFSSM